MRMALNQLQYMSLSMSVIKYDDIRQRLLSSSKDEDISPFTAVDKYDCLQSQFQIPIDALVIFLFHFIRGFSHIHIPAALFLFLFSFTSFIVSSYAAFFFILVTAACCLSSVFTVWWLGSCVLFGLLGEFFMVISVEELLFCKFRVLGIENIGGLFGDVLIPYFVGNLEQENAMIFFCSGNKYQIILGIVSFVSLWLMHWELSEKFLRHIFIEIGGHCFSNASDVFSSYFLWFFFGFSCRSMYYWPINIIS